VNTKSQPGLRRRWMRSGLWFGLALLVASCASAIEPRSFVGPNGKTAYSMECSGMGRTLDACFQKAGEVCPRGYQIVSQTSDIVGLPMGRGQGMMIAPKRGLAIECR
jgi:hypothetical protein